MVILFYVQKFVVIGNTELCRLEHFPIFNHIIHSLSKLFDFFFFNTILISCTQDLKNVHSSQLNNFKHI